MKHLNPRVVLSMVSGETLPCRYSHGVPWGTMVPYMVRLVRTVWGTVWWVRHRGTVLWYGGAVVCAAKGRPVWLRSLQKNMRKLHEIHHSDAFPLATTGGCRISMEGLVHWSGHVPSFQMGSITDTNQWDDHQNNPLVIQNSSEITVFNRKIIHKQVIFLQLCFIA